MSVLSGPSINAVQLGMGLNAWLSSRGISSFYCTFVSAEDDNHYMSKISSIEDDAKAAEIPEARKKERLGCRSQYRNGQQITACLAHAR